MMKNDAEVTSVQHSKASNFSFTSGDFRELMVCKSNHSPQSQKADKSLACLGGLNELF
jgi:hypothetical protein